MTAVGQAEAQVIQLKTNAVGQGNYALIEVGKALAGTRDREGLTQIQLSKLTGIPQRHISEMENGKRPIGKEMAKRLGKALSISYKVFL